MALATESTVGAVSACCGVKLLGFNASVHPGRTLCLSTARATFSADNTGDVYSIAAPNAAPPSSPTSAACARTIGVNGTAAPSNAPSVPVTDAASSNCDGVSQPNVNFSPRSSPDLHWIVL